MTNLYTASEDGHGYSIVDESSLSGYDYAYANDLDQVYAEAWDDPYEASSYLSECE